MKIENIRIKNDGYVYCKSDFYSADDYINRDTNYEFTTGVNKLIGEIDSGIWAVSYCLSMYKYRPKDFILSEPTEVAVNGTTIPLMELQKYTCYIDSRTYPMFTTKRTVRKQIEQGIRKNRLNCTFEEIKEYFELDDQRVERPVSCVGNERFRAMAAIGYVHGKEVYCFPWMSKRRFDNFHGNMTELLRMLEKLNKIAIVPIGR